MTTRVGDSAAAHTLEGSKLSRDINSTAKASYFGVRSYSSPAPYKLQQTDESLQFFAVAIIIQ